MFGEAEAPAPKFCLARAVSRLVKSVQVALAQSKPADFFVVNRRLVNRHITYCIYSGL
jgi:hypothetical protein